MNYQEISKYLLELLLFATIEDLSNRFNYVGLESVVIDVSFTFFNGEFLIRAIEDYYYIVINKK